MRDSAIILLLMCAIALGLIMLVQHSPQPRLPLVEAQAVPCPGVNPCKYMDCTPKKPRRIA